ncbi:SOS response-associated peptidase [Mesorhizobium sp. BE184]|uniref:SOS response-associated peptidase n=1 Tax=Mesorhizobium sp. BE184 TaxID=2817714 RepID=UPI00285ED460|nr:SOS response-associated peptidase [Mesorhizobium sp. BE184]MDR7031800.1 putative SOS response-associated peptidase YedK [Mesorhizobium sp. BE184]
MCGRFALTATTDQTAAFLGFAELEEFPARYNIAPKQPVLAVVSAGPREPFSNRPDRLAMLVRWGLIPAWVKDTRDFPLLFNARSEGIAEKASFRAAMRHRRALIPASGFYEWHKQSGGSGKGQAYWVRPKQGGLIAFAAVLETYAEPGGSEMDTGAIVTTSANDDIGHIHERMPVVVQPQHFARWLDCRSQEPRDVVDLMKPVEPGFFEALPVSDLVNKVANTGPEIQERAEIAAVREPEKAKRRTNGDADDTQLTLF